MIEDSSTRDETLLALAAKFAPDLTVDEFAAVIAVAEQKMVPVAIRHCRILAISGRPEQPGVRSGSPPNADVPG